MEEQAEKIALTEAVYYILLSLYTPMHGYGMIQKIKELSGERVILAPGTLYGAINTLLQKQWICLQEGQDEQARKKEYVITPLGKQMVEGEVIRLEELLQNGKEMIGRDIK